MTLSALLTVPDQAAGLDFGDPEVKGEVNHALQQCPSTVVSQLFHLPSSPKDCQFCCKWVKDAATGSIAAGTLKGPGLFLCEQASSSERGRDFKGAGTFLVCTGPL